MHWGHSLPLRALAAAVILAVSWPTPVSAAPHGSSLEVDVGLFYNDLSPYGRWYEVDDHGWVWRPRVSSGWRPYTVGQWVWTDEYGWMWTSSEPYSWAVYHYGRWDWDPELGWLWVPGYDWAPAWVSYRSGGGYVGWAPLPPTVSWGVGVGFRVGAVQFDTYISPRHYTFVDERSFLDRDVGRRAYPLSRNATIVNVTRNITDYDVSGGRVRNRSLSVDRVERFTRRAVPRVRAVEVNSVREVRSASVRGDRVEVFRPMVRRDADRRQVERRPPDGRRLGRAIAQDPRREPQATSRGLEERRQAEHEQRLAAQREAERQRALDRQREADRRDQERRMAREREAREEQRRELEKRQQREREAIEARHRQEIKRPSRDPRDELDRRHSQEHRAVDERQHRERQQVEAQREQARRERDTQGERRAAADERGGDNNKKKKETRPKREPEKERPRERPPSR